MKFEVKFDHSINRIGQNSYTSQSQNQGSMVVEANGSSQAENLVRSMFGGHQNCHIKTVVQKY